MGERKSKIRCQVLLQENCSFSKAIKSSRVLAFPDLGMEAIYEFEVVDMPVTVAVDSQGTSVHQTGPAEWQHRIAQSLPGTAVLQ